MLWSRSRWFCSRDSMVYAAPQISQAYMGSELSSSSSPPLASWLLTASPPTTLLFSIMFCRSACSAAATVTRSTPPVPPLLPLPPPTPPRFVDWASPFGVPFWLPLLPVPPPLPVMLPPSKMQCFSLKCRSNSEMAWKALLQKRHVNFLL